MEKVLFLAFIIIIAGSCYGLPAVRTPLWLVNMTKRPPIDPHAGHDHKHGHHHDGIAEVVMEHLGNILWSFIFKKLLFECTSNHLCLNNITFLFLGGKFVFSAPGEHCPPGMAVLDDDTCHEALKLYNIDATDLHENKLLHPKGCHVMHLDGKWHFNTGGSPRGHITGGWHHDICLVQKFVLGRPIRGK